MREFLLYRVFVPRKALLAQGSIWILSILSGDDLGRNAFETYELFVTLEYISVKRD